MILPVCDIQHHTVPTVATRTLDFGHLQIRVLDCKESSRPISLFHIPIQYFPFPYITKKGGAKPNTMTSPLPEVPNVPATISVDPRPSPRNQRRHSHSNPLSPRKNLVAPLKSPGAAFRNTRKSLGAIPNFAVDHGKMLMPPPSPPGSFRPLSPRLSGGVDTQKIAEQMAQQERQRMKEMEQEELKMTADELRFILKQERRRMLEFAVDLAKLRSTAAHAQAESEMHEERAINGLMRKLDTLKGEKSRLMMELEREEDLVRSFQLFICGSNTVAICQVMQN